MRLTSADLLIVALYLVGITLFGMRFRKRQRTLRDYFLADRNIPWWAIALSIVAAETSTLTIISIPGLAYDTNLTFCRSYSDTLSGASSSASCSCRIIFEVTSITAYELIERRFGRPLAIVDSRAVPVTRAAGGRCARVRGFDRGRESR